MRHHSPIPPGDTGLEGKIAREIEGEVLFDPATRGRYSTDASIYQIEPVGVVIPKNVDDIVASISIASESGVPVLPRGGGTSQCGQTVGEALVIDVSKYLNRIIEIDKHNRRAKVQPGVVLDDLNAALRPQNLFFPVDVSTANRATLGGMAGNNSCGSRSIRYGNMVHNVNAIKALLSDGSSVHMGPIKANLQDFQGSDRLLNIVQRLQALGAREKEEIERRFPKLLRRVGGYNIDTIDPNGSNFAHILVGSEGTLGFFTELELALQPTPNHTVLGICHFDSFHSAMEAPQKIVDLNPTAVELVDRTLMDLAYEIDMFRPILDRFIQGHPQALLLVEFTGEELTQLTKQLGALEELVGSNSLVKVTDKQSQNAVWNVRKQGLNIVMSMKGDGKPISFVEDCAVKLKDLPEYTRRLDEIFRQHGTSGTWYAHASVGTLHVRPILNLKDPIAAKTLRSIAEECFQMVRDYRGSHSGEHGDGITRSEFHEAMFGKQIVRAFEEVKDIFDPIRLFNPGKIVHAEKLDDRSIFRFHPQYKVIPTKQVLDWSEWGGIHGAVEMCNNNGACRKLDVGVMCPSYRVTRDEKHLTRGRANTLRLALTGQLTDHNADQDPLNTQAVSESLNLCVGCKGCKRECPTGIDMTRLKIEHLSAKNRANGVSLHDRLIGHLPQYAAFASQFNPLINLRNSSKSLRWLSEKITGFSKERELPTWVNKNFDFPRQPPEAVDVVVFVDTFNKWFEPENVVSAKRVLSSMGLRVGFVGGDQRVCCGRTYLSTGMIDEAKKEASRTHALLAPYANLGLPIVGLEPSCLFTFKDEHLSLLGNKLASKVSAHMMLIEEFLALHAEQISLKVRPSQDCLVHGHCHQKAFSKFDAVLKTLQLTSTQTTPIDSSCCGMAGQFGYAPEHQQISRDMAELTLLPSIRSAPDNTTIAASGFSCRQQIAHGTSKKAIHPIRIIDNALID